MKESFPLKNAEDDLEKEIAYCNKLINRIRENETISQFPKVEEKLNQLEEILRGDAEHLQASKDEDARVGHKTTDSSFLGYKTHIAMTEGEGVNLVVKLNPSVTQGFRAKEDEFQFNKDAGMYVCKAGHMAIRKARQGKKNVSTNQTDTYYFDVETYKGCPYKAGCYKDGAQSKTYSFTIKSDIHKTKTAKGIKNTISFAVFLFMSLFLLKIS